MCNALRDQQNAARRQVVLLGVGLDPSDAADDNKDLVAVMGVGGRAERRSVDDQVDVVRAEDLVEQWLHVHGAAALEPRLAGSRWSQARPIRLGRPLNAIKHIGRTEYPKMVR